MTSWTSDRPPMSPRKASVDANGEGDVRPILKSTSVDNVGSHSRKNNGTPRTSIFSQFHGPRFLRLPPSVCYSLQHRPNSFLAISFVPILACRNMSSLPPHACDPSPPPESDPLCPSPGPHPSLHLLGPQILLHLPHRRPCTSLAEAGRTGRLLARHCRRECAAESPLAVEGASVRTRYHFLQVGR